MKKLSTDSYKGVRDFYPEDMFIENYIFDVMRAVCESFGYREYDASPLELSELYEEKTSEEIVSEQTYTFEDRGGRRVTLRPEMTPTLARMVAAKKRDYQLPIRWYAIPNMFRYERQQKGRLREHYQLNVDIMGVSGVLPEAEIIECSVRIMEAFGAKPSTYKIRLNSRKVLNAAIKAAKLNNIEGKKYLALLDKKEKMDKEEYEKARLELLEDGDDPLEIILSESDQEVKEAEAELFALTEELRSRGIENVERDHTVVRGFDYYTGMVFEIFDTSKENNRSLLGGGRYDDLLELFGSETLPTVGFGMGDVTIKDFLETHDLLPEYTSSTDVFIATETEDLSSEANIVAKKLRDEGVNVIVNALPRSLSDQAKYAAKLSIPFLLTVKESGAKTFTFKNLETKEESELAVSDIVEKISE